jgi:uncharacterized protein
VVCAEDVILRDPVHGILAFEDDESSIVTRLLRTREVQRLRRIRQLGVTNLAYPGAEHTRFAHALGAAHIMQRLLRRLRQIDGDLPFWQRVSSGRASDAMAAALLHDIGHGPLSHLFESALPRLPHHEVWSKRMMLDPSTEVFAVLSEGDPGRPARVADLIDGKHELPYLARAVSGTFDVDRCDYLLRDAHSTGVKHGHFDLDWVLRSLRFGLSDHGPPALAIDGQKGLVAIEEFVLARLFMFQQVYFHKATRAAEWMIREALRLAVERLAEGDELAMVPEAFRTAAQGGELSLDGYLELDDTSIWAALHAWEKAAHPHLRDLCLRIRRRELFKTFELFGEAREPENVERALVIARGIAEAHGLSPVHHVGVDIADDVPFDEADDPPEVVFSKGAPRPLGEVSFLLSRLRGEEIRKVRIVFAKELREPISTALAALPAVFGSSPS